MNNPIASGVLMVYPTSFGYDEQTAQTNSFQHRLDGDAVAIRSRAQAEFDAMVATLQSRGIDVVVARDDDQPPKPNAVFPNNWLTTWPDGRLFTYPMATPSRRLERSAAVLHELARRYQVGDVLDFSATEDHGTYLEGTGVLVFDHAHRRAYAAVSPRCDEALAREHVQSLGYEPVIFHAYDAQGVPVYHTNVLMGVQSATAVICAEAIIDEAERRRVLESLQQTGHDVVAISVDQMAHFCGNVIELANPAGERFLLLSQAAYDAFTPRQRATLGRDKTLLPVAIPTIEAIGGGSARCMVAEIFLPAKVPAAQA